MVASAVTFRNLLLFAVVAAMPLAASAGKKCHKCDFSDEPIIVVGDKPSKNAPAQPAAKQLRAAPAPTLPPRRTSPAAGVPQVLSGGAPPVQHVQLHCNTISLCNDLIAYCAEKGGQWVPGGSGPQGEPSSGDCFID